MTLGLGAVLLCVVAAYVVGRRHGGAHDVLSAAPADARRIAFVRDSCRSTPCQTLWLGRTREDAVQVAALIPGRELCEEIAWASDGYRMGFLINGYQLRVFDVESRKPVAQVNLIPPDGSPTSHIARGVTFSLNGAAVTFDNCPRYTSGCRSGLAAIR
jgi:hypothetical protein